MFFKIRIRGWFRVRVGGGAGFRVRVRERVSVRAKVWLGFMYYSLKLLELKLRDGHGFGEKNLWQESRSHVLAKSLSLIEGKAANKNIR